MTQFGHNLLKYASTNVPEIAISEAKAEQFECLLEALQEANNEVNLTSITDPDEVLLKHFLDSLTVAPLIPEGAKLADVGCGGGFPTFPIAIAREDVTVVGIDSVAKKIRCVTQIAQKIGLTNVKAVSGRAEELAHDAKYREQFDCVTARAVTKIPFLLEFCLPLLKVGGLFFIMKSVGADEELDASAHALEIMGGKVLEKRRIVLKTDGDPIYRTIIVVQKERATAAAYPRKYAQMLKKPL